MPVCSDFVNEILKQNNGTCGYTQSFFRILYTDIISPQETRCHFVLVISINMVIRIWSSLATWVSN